MATIEQIAKQELDDARAAKDRGSEAVEHYLSKVRDLAQARRYLKDDYTGRYPLELLQNVNDAIAQTGQRGHARFHVSDSALIVADTGGGFDDGNVRGILALGQSTKQPGEFVGYKGIGFNAVAEICQRPEIYSVKESFRLDPDYVRSQLEAVLGIDLTHHAFPAQLIPAPATHSGPDSAIVKELFESGFSTVIRLPLLPSIHRDVVANHLAEALNPTSLIFLPALVDLVVTGVPEPCHWSVDRHSQGHEEIVSINGHDGQTVWRVFSRAVALHSALTEPLGEEWSERQSTEVQVAIPVEPDGQPAISGSYPLHAFFPTEEQTGLGALFTADFVLEPSRKRLLGGPSATAYNHHLIAALANLFAGDCARIFARQFPASPRVVELFAPRGTADGHGGELMDACNEVLRRTPFVTTGTGNIAAPEAVALLPANAPDPGQLHRHLGNKELSGLVHQNIQGQRACRSLLANLGASKLSWDETIARLRHPPDGDIADYYGLLATSFGALRKAGWTDRNDFLAALRTRPCLRTTDGQWVIPGDRVFLPGKEQPELSALYAVVEVPDVPGLYDLLTELEVPRWSLKKVIDQVAIPVLADRSAAERERTEATALAFKYFSRHQGRTKHDATTHDVLVPVRGSGSELTLASAGEVFLGSDWTGLPRLEGLLTAASHYLFLQSPDQIQIFDPDFWRWLGVADHLTLDAVESPLGDRHAEFGELFRPHRSSQLWSQWSESEQTLEARQCPLGHPQSQGLVKSVHLPVLEVLCAKGDRELLADLWFELADSWDQMGLGASEASFQCFHGATHPKGRERTCPSLFQFSLENLDWVPAHLNGKPVLTRPGSCWEQVPQQLKALVPGVDRQLLGGNGKVLARHLGVITQEEVPVEALCQLLRELSRRETNPTEQTHRTAEWLVKVLDTQLSASPLDHREALEELPLPVLVGGHRSFAAHPWVAAHPDRVARLLVDYPILSASVVSEGSIKALELKELSSLDLREEVAERGTRPEWGHRLTRELGGRLAEVAAIAIHASPQKETGIIRRLRDLSFSGCEGFDLITRLGDLFDTEEDPGPVYLAEHSAEDTNQTSYAVVHITCDSDGKPENLYPLGGQLTSYLGIAKSHRDALSNVLYGEPNLVADVLDDRGIDNAEVTRLRWALSDAHEDDTSEYFELAKTSHVVETTAQSATVQQHEDGNLRSGSAQPSSPSLPTPNQARPAESPTPSSSPPPLAEVQPKQLEVVRAQIGVPGNTRSLAVPSDRDGEAARSNRSTRTASAWTPSGDEREIGSRGEEIVLELERSRAVRLGLDPDQVIWHAKEHPTAPYDIRGLTGDGGIRYIEVKSTDQSDPATPFMMSRPELEFAKANRDSYVLFRVSQALSLTPQYIEISDYADLVESFPDSLRATEYRIVLPLKYTRHI